MVHTLTKAERLILEEMYPVGSRVQLEHMELDPYCELPRKLTLVQIKWLIHALYECLESFT